MKKLILLVTLVVDRGRRVLRLEDDEGRRGCCGWGGDKVDPWTHVHAADGRGAPRPARRLSD